MRLPATASPADVTAVKAAVGRCAVTTDDMTASAEEQPRRARTRRYSSWAEAEAGGFV
jgi:hypothetical protein